MVLMTPVGEMSGDDEPDEPLLDVYGTPWGQVLSGVDPDVLITRGSATVRIPAGIPDLE
jgi:uncharacterized membrane-anchored protein